MNHQETQEHHAVQISQLYTELYPQMVPQQGNLGEEKPRRRRKTNRSSDTVEKKRKLTEAQVHLLERNFESEHKLDPDRKERLAAESGLDPRQVAVWFQNRRARWRNKKLEEEYSNLKKLHESVVIENYHLETQIFKLKERLSEVEKEKEKERPIMGERADGPLSSSSPSPSMPMETVDPTCLGTSFEVEDLCDCMPENTCFYAMEFVCPDI